MIIFLGNTIQKDKLDNMIDNYKNNDYPYDRSYYIDNMIKNNAIYIHLNVTYKINKLIYYDKYIKTIYKIDNIEILKIIYPYSKLYTF